MEPNNETTKPSLQILVRAFCTKQKRLLGSTLLKLGFTLSGLGSTFAKPGFEETLLQGALRLKGSIGLHIIETGLHIVKARLHIVGAGFHIFEPGFEE